MALRAVLFAVCALLLLLAPTADARSLFFHPRAEREARAARQRNHLSNTGTGRKLSEAQEGIARAARMLFDGVRFQPGLTGRKLSQDSELVPKRMLFDGVRFQPGLTGRKLSDESDRSQPDVDFILD